MRYAYDTHEPDRLPQHRRAVGLRMSRRGEPESLHCRARPTRLPHPLASRPLALAAAPVPLWRSPHHGIELGRHGLVQLEPGVRQAQILERDLPAPSRERPLLRLVRRPPN